MRSLKKPPALAVGVYHDDNDSTSKMVEANGVQCRVWEGETAAGVKVVVLIPRIAVKRQTKAHSGSAGQTRRGER